MNFIFAKMSCNKPKQNYTELYKTTGHINNNLEEKNANGHEGG